MALLNLHQLIFLGKLLKNKCKVGISKVAVLQPAVLLPFPPPVYFQNFSLEHLFERESKIL